MRKMMVIETMTPACVRSRALCECSRRCCCNNNNNNNNNNNTYVTFSILRYMNAFEVRAHFVCLAKRKYEVRSCYLRCSRTLFGRNATTKHKNDNKYFKKNLNNFNIKM